MRRGLLAVAALALASALPWAASPIRPVGWHPVNVLEGAATGRLEHAARLPLVTGRAPTALLPDGEGGLYVPTDDGELLWYDSAAAGRVDDPAGHAKPASHARGLGRPVGVGLVGGLQVVVADATGRIWSVDDSGSGEVVAETCGGTPLGRVTAMTASSGPDWLVWFTDAGRFGHEDLELGLLEGKPGGRLCVMGPGAPGPVEVVAGLHQPLGVALDRPGGRVLVAEAGRRRLLAVQAGGGPASVQVVVDGLPGVPMGLSVGEEGRIWVALGVPASWRHRAPALLRRWLGGVWALWRRVPSEPWPDAWRPKPASQNRVLVFDRTGALLHWLEGPSPGVLSGVSMAVEDGDVVWLASQQDHAVASAVWRE